MKRTPEELLYEMQERVAIMTENGVSPERAEAVARIQVYGEQEKK